jgi:hypothetical protein
MRAIHGDRILHYLYEVLLSVRGDIIKFSLVLDTLTLPALTLAHPPPRTRGSSNLLSFPDLHGHLPVLLARVRELSIRTLLGYECLHLIHRSGDCRNVIRRMNVLF